MTLSPFPRWDPEAKAPKGVLFQQIFYLKSAAAARFLTVSSQQSFMCLGLCLDPQGRTVSHHVERAGNFSQNARRGHRQTPAGTGLHHRVPQQTCRRRGQEEEREEEGGQGRQNREKRQQGYRGQKLAGLGEVRHVWFLEFRSKNNEWSLYYVVLSLCFLTCRLKGLLDKDEQESEVIKDSPDSPEPLNKKPRLSTEEVQPPERAKGNTSAAFIS